MAIKRILLYSINYSPELTGIGKYNGEMAAWLSNNGYEVRVVTAPPYYPEWRVQQGYSAWRYAKERADGIDVWRCPLWVPRRPSGLSRLVHLLTFALSSFPVMLLQLLWRPQLLLVIEPPLAISPLAVVLGKLFGIRSWLHVQDFEVDAAFELGLLPKKKWLQRFVLGAERRLMRSFDSVSSISKPMLARLIDKGVPEAKAKYFPNWANVSAIFPLPESGVAIRRELAIDDHDFVVLYSGNIGEKQGLEILLEAAERLRERIGIVFVICGSGAAKEKLQRISAEKELANVKYLPLQPLEKLNELLNMANVHALIQKGSAADLVMPSKLTGMMASGRPIIATAGDRTAIFAVMQDAEAGILIPPEDADSLTDAILTLTQDAEAGEAFGQKAREYAVKHLSKETIMAQFELQLQGIRRGAIGR